MKHHSTIIFLLLNRARRIVLPFIIFMFFSALAATPAYSIRLTFVKHLFDMTHGFSEPSDISVSKDGHAYVVDGVNNQIKVFNQNGKHLYSFGSKGSRNGELRFPLGIGIGGSGKVYIADSGNRRVQVFTSQGSFLDQFSIPPVSGNPSEPVDIAVDDARGRCYVVDNNNHRILAYDLHTFGLLDVYGSPGTERNEFRYPFLITLDKYQYLYIVDVINTRVQMLNPEGHFVSEIGGWGVEKGEFFRPKGVAIDDHNRVYVSDSYMGVIQVFSPTGEFYSVLADPDNGKVKKFITPTGIFIDGNNRIFVVEMFAEKVSVYQIEGDSE